MILSFRNCLFLGAMLCSISGVNYTTIFGKKSSKICHPSIFSHVKKSPPKKTPKPSGIERPWQRALGDGLCSRWHYRGVDRTRRPTRCPLTTLLMVQKSQGRLNHRFGWLELKPWYRMGFLNYQLVIVCWISEASTVWNWMSLPLSIDRFENVKPFEWILNLFRGYKLEPEEKSLRCSSWDMFGFSSAHVFSRKTPKKMVEAFFSRCAMNQLMVNWWFGAKGGLGF